MVLSTQEKQIKYLSYAYHGSVHDISILRSELPPEKGNWFTQHEVHLDLGYLGVKQDYIFGRLFIPEKKTKKKPLTKGQKEGNKIKSQHRVVVENAIGGMKRFRFLSDRLRCRNINLYNKIAGISAGLWNFNLTH